MKTKYLFLFVVSLVVVFTGCVKDEIFEGPPVISNVAISPQNPGQGDAVKVSAKVVDLHGVETVTLYYKKSGDASFTSVVMTASGNTYSADIPAQSGGVTVTYYIHALNVIDKASTSPANAPTTTAAYTVGAALIVMNEIQARGVTGDPDWIEIYNGSDSPVNISGYKIYDSGGQSGSKPKMTFPTGTTIAAKGFFVVVVDDAATANPAGSNFGLSSGGEQIWLENASGYVIDTFTFGVTADATQTYGRKPDGSTTFVVFTQITKGSSNNNAATAK